MPAIIDHDARRAELARIAADLIAAEGLEASTVRAIAAAAGFSTKVVSHYFKDKRALLLMTYRFAADDSAARAAGARGRADAKAHALSLLPTTPPMRRNWRVWLAFWGAAFSDPAFAAEQRGQVARARGDLEAVLARDPRFEILPEPTRQACARDLVTTVIGVALQAAFDERDWPRQRQERALEDRLGRWAGSCDPAVTTGS